jgi:hypothetical protein
MTLTATVLAFLLSPATAGPPRPAQAVRLEVATARGFPGLQIEAHTTWLGVERTLQLHDDGQVPGDVPGDGLYVGTWMGDAVRVLPIRLVVSSDAHAPFEAYGGLERIVQPVDRLAWALDLDETPTARRVAAPLLARPMEARELSGVAASLGWACLAFLYVAWLVGRARPES